ncbi:MULTISPECIES: 16S rRNA (cytosine(967)-C(5))-methyltransferase RsmB [Acutalibacteraceae]|uniref:16S rRNA (cytosine(967)-C(5))-methyltransferase RsmB n=1 Tax=Acutalibacteraceae TaxID=3082771 RepID=UPI001FAA3360|nr:MULTISPECIES: 16S rRNA (cytosine(967)-C(5))-methyltransferase RsmB [Acutalibacteraceae]
MTGAREAALQALLRVDSQGAYSNLVLDHLLSGAAMEPRDRSLATTIFYGVLERRITLDYVIGRFSSIPLEKISPVALELLRMGAYQILYLDKIPASAAVNESVSLAKTCGAKRASGFVNAVLRNFVRSGGKLPAFRPETGPLRRISVEYSCPEWIVSLWNGAYGEQMALRLLESMTKKPDLYARVNNTRIGEEQLIERLRGEGIDAVPVPWPGQAIRLEKGMEFADSGCYRDGLLHIQDLSSQILCALVDPRPGETVVDVCSAPGGKAFTLAERMGDRGRIFAYDKYPKKAGLIREGARRLCLSCVEAGVRDAADPKEGPEPADRVLCDVPCSGLGVLRRKPEIRFKSPGPIDSLPDLQYLILCKSSGLVRKGGVLFYSTCTLNPAENGAVADRFLAGHAEFEPLPLSLPQTFRREVEEPENQMTFLPYLHGTDGFFVAAFRRN